MVHDVDLFEEEAQMVRMTFAEHLEDLRVHLIRALVGLVPGVIVGLFLGGAVVRYMSEPAREALLAYYQEDLLARQRQYQEQVRRGEPVPLVQIPAYIDREQFRTLLREALAERATADTDEPDPAAAESTDAGGTNSTPGNAQRQPTPDPATSTSAGSGTQSSNGFGRDAASRPWYQPLLDWAGLQPDAQRQEEPIQPPVVEREVPLSELNEKYLQLPMWTPKVTLEAAGSLPDLDSAIVSLGPYETIMAYLKASFVVGIVLTSPWIFYQIWSFVAAGLYSYERRVVYRFLPFSTGLFLAGVLFCFFIVLPVILNFLLSFNRWIGIKPQIRLSEWMGFATMLPVMFGLSFELPLVMLALERVGIFTVDDYRTKRRHAILVIAFLSMMLTPPDPGSMLAMMLPALALYELGIQLCRWYRPAAVPRAQREKPAGASQ